MGRIKTPITGITTTSAYDEGSCFSLVNLRPKNGALYPVAPRKIIQELSQEYDIVFVHQNNDYKNWVGVINNGNFSSVYWDVRDEHPQSIASIQGIINSVQQIGNTLSLITEDNIYYLFYLNGKYTFLGEIPDIPTIQLAANFTANAKLYYANEYGANTISKDNFVDATKGLLNKGRDQLIEEYGQLFSDAFFMRYAYRLYDGTLIKHSAPILVLPPKEITTIKQMQFRFYFYDGEWLTSDSFVTTEGFTINLNYDLSIGLDNWTDIIKSVDVFISSPIGISNTEDIKQNYLNDISTGWNIINVPKKGYTSDVLSKVKEVSTFYHIRTLDIGTSSDFLGNKLPDESKDVAKLENLIYQEVMTDDNFSHHKYGALCSYAYNNRLHLGNLRTTFYHGYNYSQFMWLSDYNGVSSPTGNCKSIVIEVELQAGANTGKVYTSYTNCFGNISKLFSSAFISYPDPRARKITIYEIGLDNKWRQVFSVNLTAHSFLNLAYFLTSELKPIVASSDPREITNPPDITKDVVLSESNKIKVSELSNPLNFPNVNVYQVGNGTILAMATNTMNVSDRNYGQYPLYVFTTQGIWNLNIGSGEVLYSTQSAPTSTEAPIKPIVESTPFGVVFVSTRGLMIINGQDVTFISSQIEQPYQKIEQETNVRIEELLHTFEKQTFSEYLKNLSGLVYNPYENELIVCNKESGFNYVLNFYIKSFYQSTEVVESAVKNTFPDLYVIGESKLKHYLDPETKRTHVSFMLRPFSYGNESTKWLQNIKIPFTLYNVERMFVGIYASSDNVKFPGRYGKFYEAMNRAVSYDTKTMASNTARYFLLSFAAILDDDSYLDIIDSEVTTKYNNM